MAVYDRLEQFLQNKGVIEMNAFENYKATVENFENVVRLAIETGTDVLLVEEGGEKFLRADFVHAYDNGNVLWWEDAGECVNHLAKGEYPVGVE